METTSQTNKSIRSVAEAYFAMQNPSVDRPNWVPSAITNEQVEGFTKAIHEARANNQSIVEFAGKQYKIGVKEAVFPELGHEKEILAKNLETAYKEPMHDAPTQTENKEMEDECWDKGNAPEYVDMSKKIQVANKDNKETADSAAGMMRPSMAEGAMMDEADDQPHQVSQKASKASEKANQTNKPAHHALAAKAHHKAAMANLHHIDRSIVKHHFDLASAHSEKALEEGVYEEENESPEKLANLQGAEVTTNQNADDAANKPAFGAGEEEEGKKMMDEETEESKNAHKASHHAFTASGVAHHYHGTKEIDLPLQAAASHRNAHQKHHEAAASFPLGSHMNAYHSKESERHLGSVTKHLHDASEKAHKNKDAVDHSLVAHHYNIAASQTHHPKTASEYLNKSKQHSDTAEKMMEEGLYTTEEVKQEDENVGTFHFKKEKAVQAGKSSFSVDGKTFPVKAESTQDAFETKQHMDEVLSPSDPAAKWIHDFVHSKNPKFAGKSKEMRQKMALGAYYGAQKESIQVNSKQQMLNVADAYSQMQNKETGPDASTAGPEVMDPSTEKMRDLHVKNVDINDTANIGAAQDGANELQHAELNHSKPEDAVIPKIK